MVGDVIDGKYELVRQLGEGGMGTVWEALNRSTGRRVALKVMLRELLARGDDLASRFAREARAAAQIDSEHIAQVFDAGRDPTSGCPYIVMEFLAGEDLAQTIERVGPLREEIALRVLAQSLDGIVAAHAAGVVHRDLKPANLFLAQREGGGIVVKLLDFGVAKLKASHLGSDENVALTRTGSMIGSPLYMSPEQAKGAKNVDHRTDIWSLGVVFYEALTGQAPFAHADTLGTLILAICSEKPRLLQENAPWVRADVAAIVHRAMRADVDARYATAIEMRDAIRAQLANDFHLTRDMLQPLSSTERSSVMPRFASSAPPSLTSALAQSVVMPPATSFADSNVSMAQGLVRSRIDLPKRPIWPWAAGAAGVAIAGAAIAFGVHASSTSGAHPPSTTAPIAPTTAIATATTTITTTTIAVATTMEDTPPLVASARASVATPVRVAASSATAAVTKPLASAVVAQPATTAKVTPPGALTVDKSM